VRLANEEHDLHERGIEIVAVSVDSPERNEAFRRRWHLPFPVISDPDGNELLKPLDAWNADERGGIGWPTLILFAPDGSEALRMRSRDFADRPTDDDVFAAGRRLDRPAIAPGPGPPGAEPVDAPDALRTEAFGPYFRGIRFATIALAGRLEDQRDVAETVALSDMAASFLAAWKQRRQIADG
jgi:hypothetical protein